MEQLIYWSQHTGKQYTDKQSKAPYNQITISPQKVHNNIGKLNQSIHHNEKRKNPYTAFKQILPRKEIQQIDIRQNTISYIIHTIRHKIQNYQPDSKTEKKQNIQ